MTALRWRAAAVALSGALAVGTYGCGAPAPTHDPTATPTTSAPTTSAPTTSTPDAPEPTTSEPAADPTPATPPARWVPPAQVSWQWQLSDELDLTAQAEVYDVDLFTTPERQLRQLHAAGRSAICYVSAGSYEPGRPDSSRYPPAVLGAELDGWPGERWLDIRRLDVLVPLLAARMDLCAAKGFDAVEPDNVDGYVNDTGFDLTAADQEAFNRELARLAHERGLAVGLKNDLDQVAVLEPVFDFAVNEQCFEYDECDLLRPFVDAGKPVLHVEYELDPEEFCPAARELGFSSMRKDLDLDAARIPC